MPAGRARSRLRSIVLRSRRRRRASARPSHVEIYGRLSRNRWRRRTGRFGRRRWGRSGCGRRGLLRLRWRFGPRGGVGSSLFRRLGRSWLGGLRGGRCRRRHLRHRIGPQRRSFAAARLHLGAFRLGLGGLVGRLAAFGFAAFGFSFAGIHLRSLGLCLRLGLDLRLALLVVCRRRRGIDLRRLITSRLAALAETLGLAPFGDSLALGLRTFLRSFFGRPRGALLTRALGRGSGTLAFRLGGLLGTLPAALMFR